MSNEIKYYPFTESQYVVRQAEGLCGQIYNNITILLNFDQDDIDADLMENALNQAIERFPSAKTRVHDFKKSELEAIEGHEVKVNPILTKSNPNQTDPIIPRQYFAESTDVKCERMSFKSDKKMYKFIDKFVKTPFPNNYNDCPLFQVILVQRESGRYAALLKFYHVIADTYGLLKYCEDFVMIYKSLKEGTPMPKPLLPILPALEEAWSYEGSEQEQKDITFWNEFWHSVKTPQGATLNGFDNKKCYIPGKKYNNLINLFNTKAKQVNYRISADLTNRVNEFAAENNISPKIVYLLSLFTWVSMHCDNYDAFTFNDISANRSKLKFSKTSGSFASSMWHYLNAEDSLTFTEACNKVKSNYFKCAKHALLNNAVLTTELAKIIEIEAFKLPWVRSTIAINFTYQPYIMASSDQTLKMSMERFASGKSPMPLYAMFMPTDNYTGEMNLNFEYCLSMHSKKDFDEFYPFMLKFLDTAVSNPETTIGELKKLK